MYYVVQVAPGTENRTEALIGTWVERSLYDKCFHPMRHMRRKIRGEWRDIHEKLVPGYVFVTTDSVGEFFQELKQVPAFTRLLGAGENDIFVPLAEDETRWLECALAGGTEAALSQVAVSEGDIVTILSGPLKDMEGQIKKVNLHRRIAEVKINFMNRNIVIHLGIEIIRKGK